MNIQTLTVHLGLTRAALMGIILLGAGAALTSVGLFLEWYSSQPIVFGLFVLAIPVVAIFVLQKFMKLNLQCPLDTALDFEIRSMPLVRMMMQKSLAYYGRLPTQI